MRPRRQIKGTLILQAGRHRRAAVAKAADLLLAGGLVAFPTETVYGLGAAVNRPEAVRLIYQVKGRPADNPLIIHIAGHEQLFEVASPVPPVAVQLSRRFWPGPLSLVLPRSAAIAPAVSAGLPTVAVRMPDHPVALELIAATGVPVAAPSANLSGRPSPTAARHVLEDLAGKIDAVLDGGDCRVGVESTVLDLTGSRPVILRPGGISREELEQFLKIKLAGVYRELAGEAPRSPGMKYRHYAPRAPLILITGQPQRRARLMQTLTSYYRKRGLQVALLYPPRGRQTAAATTGQPPTLARQLYASLRASDRQKAGVILAEETGREGIGFAVMNRLRKAATRVIRV